MSNWVYKWYDSAGTWNADTMADAFVPLVEPGYLAAPSWQKPVMRGCAGACVDASTRSAEEIPCPQ
jgi:hypothetical protein